MLPNRTNQVARAILAGGVASVVAVVAVITTLTVTTLSTTTLKVGSGGTVIDGKYIATQAVNVDPLNNGQSTSTVVTVTGAVATDHCTVNVVAGDLAGGTTSTASLSCRSAANAVTVFIRNATSTGAAFDAGMSTLSVAVESK